MSLVCRFDRLAADVAYFNGAALEEPVEACTEPPAHRVEIVGKRQDGYAVHVAAQVCHRHDEWARNTDGYLGSWKKRLPAAT